MNIPFMVVLELLLLSPRLDYLSNCVYNQIRTCRHPWPNTKETFTYTGRLPVFDPALSLLFFFFFFFRLGHTIVRWEAERLGIRP